MVSGTVDFLLAASKQKLQVVGAMLTDLTRPHVDALQADGAAAEGGGSGMEVERRAAELIEEWMRRYFGGQPFEAYDGEPFPWGQMERAEVLWDTATPEQEHPTSEPMIHTMLMDREDGDAQVVPGGQFQYRGRWMFHTLVKAAPQMPAGAGQALKDAATLGAERSCRRVADQLAWLLRNPYHAGLLARKGIHELRVLSGPRKISGGAWALRHITWEARVPHHARRAV